MDIYQEVTDKIVTLLESVDINDYTKPWINIGGLAKNIITGKPYSGINTLLLCKSELWATYKQWQSLGLQVKRGEKASMAVFYKPLIVEDKETGKDKSIPLLRKFAVFNADQIENCDALQALREKFKERKGQLEFEAIAAAELTLGGYIDRHSITLNHGGNRAFYAPAADSITMPPKEAFKTNAAYYAVLAHEAAHSTGHASRLARDIKNKFGNESYAFEELVAELASAFTCAELGIDRAPLEDHAIYIKSWLRVLKDDKRAIFKAASMAQKAVNLIFDRQAIKEEAQAESEAA